MNFAARAPGKLVLLGEYAVLEGAPALVMAVDRYAVAELVPSGSGQYELQAPDVCDEVVGFTRDAAGRVQWASNGSVERLALVAAVVEALGRQGLLPENVWRLRLDSSAFFEATDGARNKLGLGSSAAVTVALAAVLTAGAGQRARVDDRARWLGEVLEMHREFQGGHGSGLDVAAALHGGELVFQTGVSGATVEPVVWPTRLERVYVWSGHSASTANFLHALYAWRDASPRRYTARMDAVGGAAESGVAAARADDADGLFAAIEDTAAALRSLGDESKIPIVSAGHAAISAVVHTAGGVYKPCGAGGGDLGMAVADGVAGGVRVAQALRAAGYRIVELGADAAGVVVGRWADRAVEMTKDD